MSFREKIEINKPYISESTLNTYLTFLKRLNLSVDELKDFKKFSKNVEHLAYSSQRSYCSAVMAVLGDETPSEYKDHIVKSNQISNQFYSSHQKSEVQEKNWLSVEEIRKVVDKLNESRQPLTAWIVVNFYTFGILNDDVYFPPIRNEFSTFRLTTRKPKDTSKNYLYVKKNGEMFMILNRYKGSEVKKLMKEQIQTRLPDELAKKMRIYLDARNVKNGELILPKGQISTTLSRAFKKTGKRCGSSLLRKIYITKKYQKYLIPPKVVDEMNEDAKKMGHNTVSQQCYLKY